MYKLMFLVLIILTGVICSPGICSDANDGNDYPGYAKWSKASEGQLKDGNDDVSLMGRLFGSIVVILILGGIAYYVMKKLGPSIAHNTGKDIKIVETIAIGHQRQLHIINAGGKKLLIGSTGQSITKICELADDEKMEV